MKIILGKDDTPFMHEFNLSITPAQFKSIMHNKTYLFVELPLYHSSYLIIRCYIYADDVINTIYKYYFLVNESEYNTVITQFKKSNHPYYNDTTWGNWSTLKLLLGP